MSTTSYHVPYTTTVTTSSFDSPTTSQPQKTVCTQEEIDRVTREVNALS